MGIVGRGAGAEELVAACRQFDIYCVIGINEPRGRTSGDAV